MKSLAVCLLALSINPLSAEPKLTKAVQELVQLEHDWSDADVKKDVAALKRIMADDWTGIDFEGAVLNKAEALGEVAKRSDETETTTTAIGAVKVRIFGNTAVVSGTEIETSKYRGQDSSGEYIWTDVFVQRKGQWQAVSSQSTKRTAEKSDEVLASIRGPAVHHRLLLAVR